MPGLTRPTLLVFRINRPCPGSPRLPYPWLQVFISRRTIAGAGGVLFQPFVVNAFATTTRSFIYWLFICYPIINLMITLHHFLLSSSWPCEHQQWSRSHYWLGIMKIRHRTLSGSTTITLVNAVLLNCSATSLTLGIPSFWFERFLFHTPWLPLQFTFGFSTKS